MRSRTVWSSSKSGSGSSNRRLLSSEAGGAAPLSAHVERVSEVESLIAEGDRDSVELADQMVRLMTRQIDMVEAETRSESVRVEFDKRVSGARELLEKKGRKDELAALSREFASAMERGDIGTAEAASTMHWPSSHSTSGCRQSTTGSACFSSSTAASRSST